MILVAFTATTALGKCVTIVANSTAPTDAGTTGPGAVTPSITGVPVNVGEGATDQPVAELLIVDDGTATNCFTAGQKLTISFTAVLNNANLDSSDLAVYDFVGGSTNISGLAVSASSVDSFAAGGTPVTVITIDVLRDGTPGDPTTGTTGSGILLHGLKFDVSSLAVGDFLNAKLVTTLSSVITPQPVALAVVVAPGPLAIVPSALNFGNQGPNTTSAAQTVTLTNGGSVPISITHIATTAGFAQQNTCGPTIAPAASCTVSVTFSPATVGTYAGSLSINDNTPGAPHLVPLSGVGMLSGTRLLFTFVSSVGGFNTGLVVANTCSDAGVFSATSSCSVVANPSGPIRYYFFGTDPVTNTPVAASVSSDLAHGGTNLGAICRGFDASGSVAAGQTTTCAVSALLPLLPAAPQGFEGYIIAVTGFAYGSGVAMQFDATGQTTALRPALLLPNTGR